MTRYRQTLDPRASHKSKHASVTITGDTLTVDIDEAAIAAELAAAGARSIADEIKAQPGDRWHKSGHLANGLEVQRGADGKSAAIVAPADRLQRPELLEKLADDIAAVREPVTARVDQAIEKAADGIVKVRR